MGRVRDDGDLILVDTDYNRRLEVRPSGEGCVHLCVTDTNGAAAITTHLDMDDAWALADAIIKQLLRQQVGAEE